MTQSRMTAPTKAVRRLAMKPPPTTPKATAKSQPPRNAPTTPTSRSPSMPYPCPLTTRPANAPAISPIRMNRMKCIGSPLVRLRWPSRQHEHALLDHLIRLEEDRLRNRQAECLSGLEVDHQLELRRLLHR